MEMALEINELCKTYKNTKFELKNVSFSIPKGTIMGFVGKNGAGKSTTINAILNVIHKDSGVVNFFGEEMTDKTVDIRNDIAVVFDSINFSGELTTKKLEKVLSDIYARWDSSKFNTYLQRFKIPQNAKIKTFSRGTTMKLAICAALSHNAKLLILDEATSGLDPVVREEILDVFLEFVEDESNSILISSHISSDLEKIADYITFINDGKIILASSKDTLIYEYGIARMKQAEFERLNKNEYLSARKRGLQFEVLVENKLEFLRSYPEITVDNATIDEILALITKEDETNERSA